MYYFFQQQGAHKHAIFPLVDCDHHATTALFEYRGSLACIYVWLYVCLLFLIMNFEIIFPIFLYFTQFYWCFL